MSRLENVGMRVVFTTYGFPLYRHAFIEDHVYALAERGVDVCVVASAHGDHPVRTVDGSSPGSLVVRRAAWNDARPRKPLTLASTLRAAALENGSELRSLVRALRRRHHGRDFLARLYVMAPVLSFRADVVHIGWLDAATQWPDLLRALTVPIVVSAHGPDLHHAPLADEGHVERLHQVFERADLVHCVSHELEQRAFQFGVDRSKTFVGPFGVDTHFFSPADAADLDGADGNRPLRIVSVGRVHWVKAYETALQALHHVRRAGVDIDYTIIGEEDPKARVAVLVAVEELGLQGRVHLRGLASHEQVRDALRSADVFLLSSVSEGINTATLEAMAVGVPVVVADVGGMSEAVDDGRSGYVVGRRDPNAMCDAIVDLARDPARRKAMGRHGRARVIRDFDIAVRASKMLDQYERLAQR